MAINPQKLKFTSNMDQIFQTGVHAKTELHHDESGDNISSIRNVSHEPHPS